MIDKNDVKMPQQEKGLVRSTDSVYKIEELLRLVNAAENRQELRLKNDYYSRFNWFGGGASADKKSYFSYQEEAVYDFVFNLNKSGILSDQVGMGKTIEAGMIVSELASRNELRSLLIIVPNEIMAEKWNIELSDKFGIREHIVGRNSAISFPTVKCIKNLDEFSRCVFDCVCQEKFYDYYESININAWNCMTSPSVFVHKKKPENGKNETLADIIATYIKADIAKAVEMINEGFQDNPINGKAPELTFDGKKFAIKGTEFSADYTYDKEGLIAGFIKSQHVTVDYIIGQAYFIVEYFKFLKKELEAMCLAIGRFYASLPKELSAVAHRMANQYPILVIPIAYSEYFDNGDVQLHEFLNHVLMEKMKDYKHQYVSLNDKGEVELVHEDYRIVDFFIDVGYQTLIVDEVHDYIDVFKKCDRETFHNDKKMRLEYSSKNYTRYELFDDYYFIKKESLYKKLKFLADKATRKIFLTATPIKSDMVDFYLLTLLASNKDAETYRRISDGLSVGSGDFVSTDEIGKLMNNIYYSFINVLDPSATPTYYNNFSTTFSAEKARDASTDVDTAHRVVRYEYPYMNNAYLHKHVQSTKTVSEYLKSHASYMTVEELVMELIIAYRAEVNNEANVKKTLEGLLFLLNDNSRMMEKTKVVFRALLNNTVKLRFEEDFTTPDGKFIKQIRELLELSDGPRRWHKTYRKYGIRHTRHQTYNLSECEQLDKLNKNKSARFKNLPIWPRRDGKVIFLFRDDVFFDSFVNVQRALPESSADKKQISINDLPNVDKIAKDEAEKLECFENALKIFDYINDSMSGGNPINHRPQSNRYESVDISDENMVEYKLALVNKLMVGDDKSLGAISKKVLLFVENDREKVLEWFRYQKCEPLYDGEALDPVKLKAYQEKLKNYGTQSVGLDWSVSTDTKDLNTPGNMLIIIDPKRYEKGVDLQKANTMINFDIRYCPLKMEQRIGRIDRIRSGSSKQDQQINIISFVPLNDMSGFVINFFANELKMFTQWMGETTGIVSVPSDERTAEGGESVAFEDKVKNLEIYYNFIYRLCRENVSYDEMEKMAKEFKKFFGMDEYKSYADFRFIQALRDSFDQAFKNSMSPQRRGYSVENSTANVMRFNSRIGIFSPCGGTSCDTCGYCKADRLDLHNSSANFVEAIQSFYRQGINFCKRIITECNESNSGSNLHNSDKSVNNDIIRIYRDRITKMESELKTVENTINELRLNRSTKEAFTVPMRRFETIFNPMKAIYWDEVVNVYINLVISQFYKQCDSVLSSAELFEKFIKTLSVADFMNNMEGNG